MCAPGPFEEAMFHQPLLSFESSHWRLHLYGQNCSRTQVFPPKHKVCFPTHSRVSTNSTNSQQSLDNFCQSASFPAARSHKTKCVMFVCLVSNIDFLLWMSTILFQRRIGVGFYCKASSCFLSFSLVVTFGQKVIGRSKRSFTGKVMLRLGLPRVCSYTSVLILLVFSWCAFAFDGWKALKCYMFSFWLPVCQLCAFLNDCGLEI